MSNINQLLIFELNKGEKVAFSGKLPGGGQPSQATTDKILTNHGSRSLYDKDVNHYINNHDTTKLKIANAAKNTGKFLAIPGLNSSTALVNPVGLASSMAGGAALMAGSKAVARHIKNNIKHDMSQSSEFKNKDHNKLALTSSTQNQNQLTSAFHKIADKTLDNHTYAPFKGSTYLKPTFGAIGKVIDAAKGTSSQPSTLSNSQLKLKTDLSKNHGKVADIKNGAVAVRHKLVDAVKKTGSAINSLLPSIPNHPVNIYNK